MKPRLFDIVGVVAVLAFVGWVVHLATADAGLLADAERFELSDEDRAAGWRPGTEWQGIYLKEQKVGYIRLDKWKDGDLYRMRSDMVLHLTVMKSRQRIQTKLNASMDHRFVMRDFDMTIASGPADIDIRGKVVAGNKVEVEIRSAGDVQTQTVQLKEEPRMQFSLKALLARKDLAPGDKLALSFFDPASMSEREIVIEYKGRSKERYLETDVEAFHFVQNFGGVPLDVYVNQIGEVLKEQLPMGLVGVRETGVEARYGVTTGTVAPAEDVIDAVSVRPKDGRFPIKDRRVAVRLSGLNFDGLHLDGGRQKWAPVADATSGVLQIELDDLSRLRTHTIADAVQDEYTQPEPMIQSQNRLIREQARRIVGDETSVIAAAEKVSEWAFKKIDKENVIGIPSAVETLQNLRGDCNEHTTLVVGLLRSVGIPARPAIGVAYLDDRHRFFYHAWVEVRAGEQWVAIDPTFGQNEAADIGHIRFVTGGLAEQVEMFRVIGQLQIEVVNP